MAGSVDRGAGAAPGEDGADLDRLRRHLRAAASVNGQLHAQLLGAAPVRRGGIAEGWVAALEAMPRDRSPFLVRAPDGEVHVIDSGHRRVVRSGVLASVLEQALGPRRAASVDEVAGWPEGPPLEVLEGPKGAPFVVLGGARRPLRGLPLPHPVDAARVLAFPEGSTLEVRLQPARPVDEAALPPLPTFLIIGAQKSATRWLRSNLGRHPDIYAAPTEIEFFNNDERYADRGLEWYRRQFAGWGGQRVVGEATPGYMMWRHQPEVMARRVQESIPDVRLLAILRNPVDRALSALRHHQKRHRMPEATRLIDVVRAGSPEDDLLGVVAGGWYAASLRPYARRFGDRLLVLLHDDLAADAPGVYRKALAHVGASPDFQPEELDRVRFSNRDDDETDDLTAEERVEVYELYREDIDRLQDIIGRDLSGWRPGGSDQVAS